MSRRPREPSSRIRRTTLAALFGLALGLGSGLAAAGEGTQENDRDDDEPVTRPIELRHDRRVDFAVTGGLLATWMTVLLARDDLQPATCRWCDGDRTEVNGFDDWFRTALRRPDPEPANLTSHILAFGAVPLVNGALTVLSSVADKRSNAVFDDVHFVIQGTLGAVVVTEVLKPLLLRPRPYAHAIADEDVRAETFAANPDSLRSFPSGHTTVAFGAAAASGVVATMRGYRLAPLVWTAGLLLGVASAYTRIAADKHYMTDTLGGAAIGVVVGGGLPLLLHRPKKPESLLSRATLTVTPVTGGQLVGVGGVF